MSSGSIRTTASTADDYIEAEQYLMSVFIHENAQILSAVRGTEKDKATQRILITKQGDEVRAVTWINEAKVTPDWDYVALIDAEDVAAIESVIEALPCNATGYFRNHRCNLQDYFKRLPGAKCVHTELSYTVTQVTFRPVASGEVVGITINDAHLFDGCEGWAGKSLDQNGIAGRRVFAILRNGRVAASAILGPIVSNPTRELSIAGIAALYTEPAYRRMGLGKRLVSHMTELALQDHRFVHYWTTPDNKASQGLAESLGYWQYGRVIDYVWRNECTQSTP